MTSKQKAKGSAFERQLAKQLSEHYGEHFNRNISGSGAYVGGINSARKNHLDESMIRHVRGDIVVPESFSRLNIEAKSYKDFAFHLLFSNEHKQIDQWLQQLLLVADSTSINMLVFKITRLGSFVAVESKHNWDISQHSYLTYRSSKHGDWMICEFSQFMEYHSERLKKLSAPNQSTE